MPRFARRSAVVMALALASTALAACGDRTTALAPAKPAASTPPDFLLAACDWFPKEAAEALVPGIALARVRAPADPALGVDFAKCAWGAGPPTAIRVLSLELRRHATPASAAAAQADARPVLRRLVGDQLVEVPGLGEGALWGGETLRQLHLVSGDVRMIVTVQLGDPAAARAMAERIARGALAGLDEARAESRHAST